MRMPLNGGSAMPTVRLTDALSNEYQRLFETIEYTPNVSAANYPARFLDHHHDTYHEAAGEVGVPWTFVGLVHWMESGANFERHLHNGDPLNARTKHVPAGRPRKGTPPFEWKDSAVDALRGHRYAEELPRSIPRFLWWLERYNGWGYRLYHPETLSPYLWAGSKHYKAGKYGSDGVWNPTLRSAQTGAAVILRRYFELFPSKVPHWAAPPMLSADVNLPRWQFTGPTFDPSVKLLQESLSRLPGVYVAVDGKAGPMTSDAFRKVTGHYLKGDPRETVA